VNHPAENNTLETTYQPERVESTWYRYWTEHNLFRAEVNPNRPPFCIVMPPPNVTGSLHMGHALDNTLQDILTRWRRMQGFAALWLPGTDHAGIATQARVEEQLAAEGLSRFDLGREKFLERVWAWKEKYGNQITNQLRLLGSSCDWSRERFTMDEGCSEAVQEVFVRLYERGLIYRGNRIINWCSKCRTTISDIEVEHVDREGKLWHIKYPVADSDDFVVVATTRPETMLGDTGVAVHPDDQRYRHLVGKTVRLPLMNREIPVVADPGVEKEFGTGAVKVTPAHDPLDFEIGQRHQLEQVVVIGLDARMTEQAGQYEGLDRYEARRRILADLAEQGLLLQVQEHQHVVGQCYRCETVIEPLLSKQWFVKMQPLADPAIAAVEEGRIRFVPERFTRVYLNWLENIRDWCISRQLWWGHRIPVWYCESCGEVICQREEPTSCPNCPESRPVQDPDVLDTWFSSALWPFSTLGWPRSTEELNYFYPTSVLVTGRDIIFFWVARMIFSGLAFMEEVPFREVLIHGLILDAQGRKMSKSLGNGVDPIEVIERYGADTLRFMLITGTTPGNDVRFQLEKLDQTRNFANKIWNAARFVLLNLADFTPDEEEETAVIERESLELADRWILSRTNTMVRIITGRLETYDIGEAARELYEFIWNEFCDWYIELAKPALYGKDPERRRAVQTVLHIVLAKILKLLHPFMPFITEEVYHKLPGRQESLMVSQWPVWQRRLEQPETESTMNLLMELTRAVRNLRAEIKLPPGKAAPILFFTDESTVAATLQRHEQFFRTLAGVERQEVWGSEQERPRQALTAVVGSVEVYLPLAGLLDVDREIKRLEKEIAAVEADLKRTEGKLGNAAFLAKAPLSVVEQEERKRQELIGKREALRSRMDALAG